MRFTFRPGTTSRSSAPAYRYESWEAWDDHLAFRIMEGHATRGRCPINVGSLYDKPRGFEVSINPFAYGKNPPIRVEGPIGRAGVWWANLKQGSTRSSSRWWYRASMSARTFRSLSTSSQLPCLVSNGRSFS